MVNLAAINATATNSAPTETNTNVLALKTKAVKMRLAHLVLLKESWGPGARFFLVLELALEWFFYCFVLGGGGGFVAGMKLV